MHRSRPALLTIVAALTACSTRNEPAASSALLQDTSLANVGLHTDTPLRSLPQACGTVAVAAQPADVDRQRAEALTRQAYDSELVGNVPEARALLHRASELDATNRTAAYHLGRTSETMGDSAAAVAAYCHYLVLGPPTAETADARQRVARLTQPSGQLAAAAVATSAPMRQRVAYAPVRQATRRRATSQQRIVSVATTASPGRGSSGTSEARTVSSEAGGADELPPRVPDQAQAVPTTASPTSSTRRRGVSRVQGAGIGAGIGAILGAAVGRNAKSAIIGAAAGGVIGGAAGGSD